MHNSIAQPLAHQCVPASLLEVRVEALERGRSEDADRANRIEDKIDNLRGWLIGILASTLGSVLLTLLVWLLPVRK